MKFKITYRVGKNLRDKNIIAKNLDEAERIANEKEIKWLDIIQIKSKQ